MVDPTAFRSERLPTEHFNARFSDDNLRFWVPLLVAAADIGPGVAVLDVGCGTGGFARAIAALADTRVTGCDRAERFIEFARQLPEPAAGAVAWEVADAEQLPFDHCSFDRVLLSLVLHQLARPIAAVAEAFRVLRPGGRVLVRTVAPDDVAARVPERYLPALAAANATRLPRIATTAAWLRDTGFAAIASTRHLRNKPVVAEAQERELRVEARCRYPFVSHAELRAGIDRMRAEAAAAGDAWIDPRPTYIIVADKPFVPTP